MGYNNPDLHRIQRLYSYKKKWKVFHHHNRLLALSLHIYNYAFIKHSITNNIYLWLTTCISEEFFSLLYKRSKFLISVTKAQGKGIDQVQLGMRTLCWNNFGNNRMQKESGIMLE